MGVWEWASSNVALIGVIATLLIAAGGAFWKVLQGSSATHWKIHERGWGRVSELEKEISILRLALTRLDRRSHVYANLSEILILAMPLDLKSRLAAVHHARLIAELHLKNGGTG